MKEEVLSAELKQSKSKLEANSIKSISYLFIKRLFDIFFALIGCIFLLPIAVAVKISYMLTGDFSSIFYSHTRIGKNGKKFQLYKFRSMVPHADEILEKYLKENPKAAKEYKINKKLKDDPRITKVGKFIRKTSLDELPQLFNVLRGDMVMIGNRPYLPREKEDMGTYYKDIVKTAPGITGYWQVSGRSNTTFEERLKLEKYYSNHCGLKMDIKIFFKTFAVVLLKKGAK